MPKTFTLEQIEGAMYEGDIGFCTTCGEEHHPCEPDYEGPCDEDECDGTVHGAEDILVMGLVV